MSLAPLATVVAYIDRNPSGVAGMRRALQGRFDAVWSPNVECVMATRALPQSVPDSDELRASGIAFAEGRDSLAGRSVVGLRPESVPGNVGFVRVEGDRLVVVRSGPGTVPWYVWQDHEQALVSTSFTELVRLLPVAVEFDLFVCATWASFSAMFPDGRSFLRGVTAIAPGHTAELGPGRPVRSRSWWDPWPDELAWPSRAERADHVERFRLAVLTGLEREMSEAPANLLTLSGGVDSSTLAYLVARHLGRPLAALSFVPPVDGPAARLEASYLDPLVGDLGLAPTVRKPLDAPARLALLDGAPPVAFPVVHPALQVLPSLVREWGIEVLVGGEYADEACGGWFAYPDWLDAVSLPRLLVRPRSLPRGPRSVAGWAKRRIPGRARPGPWPASLPEWVSPESREEYEAWNATQLGVLFSSSAPHRYQRALRMWLDGALAMNWEVCSFLGVRRAFPFMTAEVLEVVSACHPGEVLGPGSKRLERQAFSGLVPDRHLQRPDKSGWRGESDDVAVEAPFVPALLAGAFREDMGPLPPSDAAGVAVMCRFAGCVIAAAKAGPGPSALH